MAEMTTIEDRDRIEALAKEAFRLTKEIAEIDKKIKHDLEAQNDQLALWLESNDAAKWVADQLTNSGVEKVLEKILTLLKVPTAVAAILPGVIADVFSTDKRVPRKAAYLDTRPQLAASYEQKKARLQRIYAELTYLTPPSPIAVPDRCATQLCWRAR
ncbi:MAG: hypothetical protein U1E52_19555 [Geminicoccaceae bacterium]